MGGGDIEGEFGNLDDSGMFSSQAGGRGPGEREAVDAQAAALH